MYSPVPEFELVRKRVEWFKQDRITLSGSHDISTPEGILSEIETLRMLYQWTIKSPVSSRLPIPYHWIPGVVRSKVAQLLGRITRSRLESPSWSPQWPLDLSIDALFDLLGKNDYRIKLAQDATPVILSHDLDTLEGVKNCINSFLPLEEKVGARSANYMVPMKRDFDPTLAKHIFQRGHEIGCHGYDHSNRTAFAPTEEMSKRLDDTLSTLREFNCIGYRSPSLLRTPELLSTLASRISYDTSIPTSGGLFPISNQGCLSARPYYVEGILEIPLTMPRDGSLRFLGHNPDQIYELWKSTAIQIHNSGGVVTLLTHCESTFSGNPEMLRCYERILNWINNDPRFKWSSNKELIDLMKKTHGS